MSFQAMSWAVAQTCGSAPAKLVLLMLANHANGHTGQCTPRHKTLAAECEMRVETLKTHLCKLADLGLIEIIPRFTEGVQLSNQYLLLMVGGCENRPGMGGENRPGGGGCFSPPRINQEVLNQEEEPIGFALWWKLYPKKVGKDAALSAWKRKVKTKDTIDAIMQATGEHAESDAWKKDGGQYIPNPATWLNQGRWKDEGTDQPNELQSIFSRGRQ